MRELPPSGSVDALWRDVLIAINSLIRGGSNAAGTVTLTPNATTTVVTNPNINAGASPHLAAKTANAAAALATTYTTVSSVGGSMTITHANNAQTDRTFYYSFTGSQ